MLKNILLFETVIRLATNVMSVRGSCDSNEVSLMDTTR